MFDIVEAPAHRGDLEMRVAIHKPGEDDGLAKVLDLGAGVSDRDLIAPSDGGYLTALDNHSSPLYRRSAYRQQIVGGQNFHSIFALGRRGSGREWT